jgi:hypothetical protein
MAVWSPEDREGKFEAPEEDPTPEQDAIAEDGESTANGIQRRFSEDQRMRDQQQGEIVARVILREFEYLAEVIEARMAQKPQGPPDNAHDHNIDQSKSLGEPELATAVT